MGVPLQEADWLADPAAAEPPSVAEFGAFTVEPSRGLVQAAGVQSVTVRFRAKGDVHSEERVAILISGRAPVDGQLLPFFRTLGLPTDLEALGLGGATLEELRQICRFACREGSDLHHLPFAVAPEDLLAAMVGATADRQQA